MLKMKHCKNCPAKEETDQASYLVAGGCLPSLIDMENLLKKGIVWSCHCDTSKPCAGLIDEIPESLEILKNGGRLADHSKDW